MRILIIVRSFAPDSTVASKRPTKFAKYLSQLGHDVTVIRSGRIFGKSDENNLKGLENIKVFSYEDDRTLSKDNLQPTTVKESINKNTSVSEKIKKTIPQVTKVIKCIIGPIRYYRDDGRIIKNKICNLYNHNEALRGFDVVISSFGPLGCVQAGEYISKCEQAKWIIDFRDLMNNERFSYFIRIINGIKQRRYLHNADACLCVSEGNTERLKLTNHGRFSNKIYTIYNGFETERKTGREELEKEEILFHICYTGTIHDEGEDSSPLFKVLHGMKKNNVVIDYAGRDAVKLKKQASYFGLENIIIDHGYLSSTEVGILQESADMFLVLSWNTRKDKGILTGKFYEALQHKKPIIALVTGDIPNSELKTLIDRYRLGVCYEEATNVSAEKELQKYIEHQIHKKLQENKIDYNPDKAAFKLFEYQEIVKRLEQIIKQL